MSVRTRPSPKEIGEAADLYRQLGAGELKGKRLVAGKCVRTGLLGALQGFAGLTFEMRCWITALALGGLFAAGAVLAWMLPGGGPCRKVAMRQFAANGICPHHALAGRVKSVTPRAADVRPG